jgi:TPR repeat protein
MIKSGPWFRLAIGVLVIALIAAGTWAAIQQHRRQQLEQLRQAISMAKDGKTPEAIPTLTRYALSGDLGAMMALAEIYAYGLGVPYDERRAEIWAHAATSTGHINSHGEFEYGVAVDYINGSRGDVDISRAVIWLERAAVTKSHDAQEKLANPNSIGASANVSQETVAYWNAFLRNDGG